MFIYLSSYFTGWKHIHGTFTEFSSISIDQRHVACRSLRPSGLSRGPAVTRLLWLRFRLPQGTWISVCCKRRVLSRRSLRDWPIPRSGVLPTVACHCVWPRNIKNEAALTRVGLLHQKGVGVGVVFHQWTGVGKYLLVRNRKKIRSVLVRCSSLRTSDRWVDVHRITGLRKVSALQHSSSRSQENVLHVDTNPRNLQKKIKRHVRGFPSDQNKPQSLKGFRLLQI